MTSVPLSLASVLVVEDDDRIRRDVVGQLATHGYTVSSACSADEAVALVRGGVRPDVIVTRAGVDAPVRWGLGDLPWVESVPVIGLPGAQATSARSNDDSTHLRDAVSEAIRGARLAHTERLASLGRLSAGIVHEVRNPLTAVVYAVSVVRMQIESMLHGVDDEALRARLESVARTLEVVSEGSDHIANLVRDVQSFAHPDEREHLPVDLRRVVSAAVRLGSGSGAKVEVHEGDTPMVLGNPSGLAQVVVNLVANAREAARTPRGEQVISILVYGSPDRREAYIEVRDNGTGISPEVMERLFEPFFTTKRVGVGTGLGLSLCASIVKAHGGHIDVTSTVGEGSTFVVVLPTVAAINRERPTVPAR